jgi:hypothetical protein
MKNDHVHAEWEKLCEDLNIAQGEYMELHGMLVKKATGEFGAGGPSTGDFERAKEAKARVEKLQRQLDEFLKRHVDVAS